MKALMLIFILLLSGCSIQPYSWGGEYVGDNKLVAQKVFQEIKPKFRYMSDMQQYGLVDYWALPVNGYGDCEDFALWAQKELKSRGVEGVRIVVGFVGSGEAHAVASTPDGWVLDNRMNRVVSNADLERRGYRWLYHVE